MTDTFKRGDVVKLKSGGPSMVVGDSRKDGSLTFCRWFDAIGHVQHFEFPPELLVPARTQGQRSDD